MFSHIVIGVVDFDRALGFYESVMSTLGHVLRFCERERPWAGWQGASGGRPYFVIAMPHDGLAHARGNGQMVAFTADRRALVDAAHAAALAAGGMCEGPPGLRPEYHPNYYGAYFRDPDGNKLCVACHEPEA